jgi:hypothetical protein
MVYWDEEPTRPAEESEKEIDEEVHRPAHYADGRLYEPWDVAIDWELSYCAATALKYISRYTRKGRPVQDLDKAIAFLEREKVRLKTGK